MKENGKEIHRNFDPNEAFFIIEPDSLQSVRSALYGFCIVNDTITDKLENLAGAEPSDGVYIHIKRDADTITIKQDRTGAYGIYLYRDGDYFALSNSFIHLVEYVKTKHKMTFNKSYADFLMATNYCSHIYSETMINEISLLDRSAVIKIDVPQKTISWYYVDYKENTVDLDSAEGMQILDGWYRKWTSIVKSLFDNGEDIRFDLSGGFDSRTVFSLAIGSGIDINKIYVKSDADDLHTHPEDYEIASQIAEYLGFALNNTENLSNETDNYHVEDIINMCWYIQGCCHKQNYHSYDRFKKSRYRFTGFGGECVRDYTKWCRNEKSFCEGRIASAMMFHIKDIVQMRESLKNIIGRTFDEIRSKFESFGRAPIDPVTLATVLYRETENRNHFGKATIESYFSNEIILSPLMDANLQKLKLYTSQDKNDLNALYAIILDRYCGKLLDFKFERNRKFSDATIRNAKAVNKAFPYVEQPITMHVKTDMKDVQMNKTEKVSSDALDKLMRDAFYTDEIKNTFLENYNEEVYSYISEDAKNRSYYPLSNVFALLAICKISKDVSSPNISPCSPADFIIGMAAKHTENETRTANISSLRSHELIDFYITGRVGVKNTGSDDNYIELTEISDINASINPLGGFNKNGNGYMIQSQAGLISLKFSCTQSGMLEIWLRSMNIQCKDGRRIPVQVDFQKLVVNSEVIFDTIHTISQDRPFKYSQKVSDGDVISIETEWIPYDIRKG